MIKVSVMYPKGENSTFDVDYYCNTHIPLVVKRLGESLKAHAVDAGIAGGAPSEAPTYTAMGHLVFETVDDFNKSFGPHSEEILADLVNFTNIHPQIQISEIKI